MSEPRAVVYAELRGETRRVGRLWASAGKGHEAGSFQYEDGWLAARDSFALDPALPLGGGAFQRAEGVRSPTDLRPRILQTAMATTRT